MFTVLVQIDVHPEHAVEFVAGLRANAEATLRDEPGCLRFDAHRALDVPHRFHLHEVYRDRAAFEVDHRAAPHYAVWREVTARCVVPGSHVNTYAEPL